MALNETGCRFVIVHPAARPHGSIEQQPTKFDLDPFGQAYHLALLGQVGSKRSMMDRLEMELGDDI